MMEHGCWRKGDDAGALDVERGGPLDFDYTRSYLQDSKFRLSVTLPDSLVQASMKVAAVEEVGKTKTKPEHTIASDSQTTISDGSELALHSDETFSPDSGPGLSPTFTNHNDLKHTTTPGDLVTTDQLPASIRLDSTRRFSSIGVRGGALFECLDCGKRFTNDRDWDFHISRERRRCVACDRLFECYERFLEHTPNCEPKAATASTLSHWDFTPAAF
jgi:hypothetical protein